MRRSIGPRAARSAAAAGTRSFRSRHRCAAVRRSASQSWRVISVDASKCPRCRRQRIGVSAARAIGTYDGALRVIVHALKYGKRPSVAGPLARLMIASAGDLVSTASNLVVPVPLHRRRRRARGFNQARRTGAAPGSRWKNVLRRTRATPSQTDLPAAKRHANVRNAFALRRRSREVDGADSGARGRREHDRRDAGRVRARAATGGGAGSPRPYGGASRVATAVSTSAATASRGRSPSSRSQLVEAAPAAGSCRARATSSARSRSYRRVRPPCAAPRSPARCRAGW